MPIINNKYNKFSKDTNYDSIKNVESDEDQGYIIDETTDLDAIIDLQHKQVTEEELKEASRKQEEYDNKMLQLCCRNFWCKSVFYVKRKDYMLNQTYYSTCEKCIGFDKDLSSGVIDNGVKQYKGERFDGKEHEVKITTGQWFK